jgi:hypothetical protein
MLSCFPLLILAVHRHRHRFLPQSSSGSRLTAGADGFLTLTQLSGAAGFWSCNSHVTVEGL